MDLLGGNGYQDLLNDFIINEDLEITDLTVSDSLTLTYADPNKNLVTNANKEVVTENKVFVVQERMHSRKTSV